MSGLISFLKAADPRNWKKLENQEEYNIVSLDLVHCIAKHDTSICRGYTYTYQLPDSMFHKNAYIISVHGINEFGRRIVPMQLNLIGYNTVMVTTTKPIISNLKLLCKIVTRNLVVEPPPPPIPAVPTPQQVLANVSKLPLIVERALERIRAVLTNDEYVREQFLKGDDIEIGVFEALGDTYTDVVAQELVKVGWIVKPSYGFRDDLTLTTFRLTLPSVD